MSWNAKEDEGQGEDKTCVKKQKIMQIIQIT